MNTKPIKIVVMGDVSDWNIPEFSLERIPESFRELIGTCDLYVPNLEGPIAVTDGYSGFALVKNKLVNRSLITALKALKRKQPEIFSSPKVLDLFSLAKNTCVVMANNHAKDLGAKGISDTVDLLQTRGMRCLGAGHNRREANAYQKVNVDDKDIFVLNYNFIGLRKFGMFFNIYGASRNSFGASYLSEKKIGEEIAQIKGASPDSFILLIIHHGRARADSIDETRVDYRSFEGLGADCVIFHHSHRAFDAPSDRSFFLGDFIFRSPGEKGLPENRRGGFLELTIDHATNSFDSKCHFYQFSGGFPSFDTGNCVSETKSQAKA